MILAAVFVTGVFAFVAVFVVVIAVEFRNNFFNFLSSHAKILAQNLSEVKFLWYNFRNE